MCKFSGRSDVIIIIIITIYFPDLAYVHKAGGRPGDNVIATLWHHTRD